MTTHVEITPNRADAAGRLLLALSERRPYRTIDGAVDYAWTRMSVFDLNEVANALLALGNDTDAIVAPAVPEPAFQTARTVADVEEQDRITEVWDTAPEPEETPVFKSTRTDKAAPEIDPFETATVYVTKDGLHGWTFRAYYEGGEVTKLFEALEDGLREHSGDIICFTEPEPERFEVRFWNTDEGAYRVWDNRDGRFLDGTFGERASAEVWADVMARAEGVPECDLSPESVFEIDALAADRVGQFLNDLASFTGNDLHQITFEFMRDVPRYLRCQIGDALRELSGDPSVMIVQEELPF
jgi:hypothetical protein